MVGSTPATWMISAEFCAMRLATEEAITIWYMLCSLGIPVNEAEKLFGEPRSHPEYINA